MLLSPCLPAKQMYRYQDSNGNWFFSDSKPHSKVTNLQQSTLNTRENKPPVIVRKQELSNSVQYFAHNRLGGPVQFYFELLRQDNVTSSRKLPATIILPAQKEILIAEIKQKNRFAGWSFKMSYESVPGSPNIKSHSQQHYQLPFRKSASYYVTQGFNGRFSHNSDYSRYAVDLGMPEGSAVHAVKAGMVMNINKDFNIGGTKEKLLSKANVLRILHADGTMAIYAHLQPDSVQVRIGQKIKSGQFIARSGNTGYSTGPHLHFAIEKNIDMQLTSIPFKFLSQGQWLEPTTGLKLSH